MVGGSKVKIPVEYALGKRKEHIQFKGFKSEYIENRITGNEVIRYTSEPVDFQIPLFRQNKVVRAIRAPKAYIIPKEYSSILDIFKLHGITLTFLDAPAKRTVHKYVFTEVEFSPLPYEGRNRVRARYNLWSESMEFPKGTCIVYTNQRTARVIVNLLEPDAPDSFLQWGFFNAYFERKEYAEPYIMVPIAEKMLEQNWKLRKSFFDKLESDAEFRDNPAARLDFFYQRSPFFDSKEKIYPIYRLIK
jgi:hypothetical protein